MEQPKYKAFSKDLIYRLSKAMPQIEWTTTMIPIKGKRTLVVEAYNPETDMGVGISLGQKPTTQDRTKLRDTILAQAQPLVEDSLYMEVIREEMKRG